MINDSAENSEAKYRRDFGALEQRRRKGMALLKKGVVQAEVARLVGVSRMTAMRWEHLRTEKREAAWKRRRLGRPPKKNGAQPAAQGRHSGSRQRQLAVKPRE